MSFIQRVMATTSSRSVPSELYDLQKKLKSPMWLFGSTLHRGKIEIGHDVDLVVGAEEITDLNDADKIDAKKLAILKKFSVTHKVVLDIFLGPVNPGEMNGKIIVHPTGKVKYAQMFTSSGFFDEATEI